MPAAKIQDDPRSGNTAWVGAISGLILLLTVMFLQVIYFRMEATEVAVKQGSDAAEEIELRRMEQEARLDGGYRWVDRDQGVVAMPIEDAMARIVATQGAGGD